MTDVERVAAEEEHRMASVQDRWLIEEMDATGRILKVPTRFHLHQAMAHLLPHAGTGVERPRARSKRKRYLTAAQLEVMADAAEMLEPGRPRRASNASFAQ
jgi:hypothetical protein